MLFMLKFVLLKVILGGSFRGLTFTDTSASEEVPEVYPNESKPAALLFGIYVTSKSLCAGTELLAKTELPVDTTLPPRNKVPIFGRVVIETVVALP